MRFVRNERVAYTKEDYAEVCDQYGAVDRVLVFQDGHISNFIVCTRKFDGGFLANLWCSLFHPEADRQKAKGLISFYKKTKNLFPRAVICNKMRY